MLRRIYLNRPVYYPCLRLWVGSPNRICQLNAYANVKNANISQNYPCNMDYRYGLYKPK